MKKSKGKYDKLLNVFLVMIFIELITTLGPYFYEQIKSDLAVKEALKDLEENTNTGNVSIENNGNDEQINDELDKIRGTLEDVINEMSSGEDGNDISENSTTSSSSSSQAVNYQAVGKIEIPKTGVNYPVYSGISKSTLESGVAIAYGPGLNQAGNTVIYGHNFLNGKFFSNNKKLTSGDKVYITDLEGNRVEYTIYSVYVTTPTDANYMVRDTAGRREISLQTCTDDSSGRIIVWATAD